VRYIGNKTKLLPFIGDLLDDRGIRPTRVFDAFSGTAAVGRFLKSRGASVAACDLMTFSYVFQRAYIVADAYPTLPGLADDPELRRLRSRPDFAARVDRRIGRRVAAATAAAARGAPPSATRALDEVLLYLDSYLDPHESFISRHFAAPHVEAEVVAAAAHGRDLSSIDLLAGISDRGETSGRMYFALDRARRIDAIREQLHDWHVTSMISDEEFYLLLAALLEAADSIANTTGVYAAYIKQWQPNALRELRLRLPLIVAPVSRRRRVAALPCEAYQGDVLQIAPRVGRVDLLYLDPPYNTRQYSAYYHVPEIIARGWFGEPLALRGKTGLPPNEDLKSAWSVRGQCVAALEQLVAAADADHIVMSYNSEGIIPDAEIERIFRCAGRARSFARVAREYQRYRSDRPGPTRRYKARSVREQLYYVRKKDGVRTDGV
jgi:adenine-specific DNA-methyltransferase